MGAGDHEDNQECEKRLFDTAAGKPAPLIELLPQHGKRDTQKNAKKQAFYEFQQFHGYKIKLLGVIV